MIRHVSAAGRAPSFPPRRLVPALITLAALAFGLPAGATSLVRLSLDRIVAASDAIVEGRVVSVRSYWQGRQILTEVGLSVSQALKGPGAARVSFVQLGGRVTSPFPVTMSVPGAPIHAVGDEGFYFLQPGAPGQRIVVGLSLGRVPVLRDASGPYVIHEGRRLAPSEFADEVRRILAGQAARPPAGADR